MDNCNINSPSLLSAVKQYYHKDHNSAARSASTYIPAPAVIPVVMKQEMRLSDALENENIL